MVNTDAVTHHEIAVKIAQEIKEKGWSAFKMGRYEGNRSLVSEVAALFYALSWPSPVVLLPLNAFIHALSAMVLLSILEICIGSSRKIIWATLPFVFFPSGASWYAQIHRDGYCILGFFLVLYAWLKFWKNNSETLSFLKNLVSILLLFMGYFLLGNARPYILQLLRYFLPFLVFFYFAIRLLSLRRKEISLTQFAASLLVTSIALF